MRSIGPKCLLCHSEMTLIHVEPFAGDYELLSYKCGPCDAVMHGGSATDAIATDATSFGLLEKCAPAAITWI